jgi:hypothetical protein
VSVREALLLAIVLAVLSAVMVGAAAAAGGMCDRKRCILCGRREAYGRGLLCLECRKERGP